MTNKKELKDVQVKGKKVLVRVDFNVPMRRGKLLMIIGLLQLYPQLNIC